MCYSNDERSTSKNKEVILDLVKPMSALSTTSERNKRGKAKWYKWENTNKLLDIQGFDGIKTGITPTAGPCLAARYTWE
jgi:D-alanyl-D-alanine carboxypeptidase